MTTLLEGGKHTAELIAALEAIAGMGGKCLLGPYTFGDPADVYREASAEAFGQCAAIARALIAKATP